MIRVVSARGGGLWEQAADALRASYRAGHEVLLLVPEQYTLQAERDALEALDIAMVRRDFGSAGDTVLVEQRLYGWETSCHAFCDGKTAVITGAGSGIGRALARPDWMTEYMSTGMAVLAEQIDGDLTALYSGFSQSIDATGGLGEDDFRNARRLLRLDR